MAILHERKRKHIAFTRGMAGAAMKGRTVARRCVGCGLGLARYPGAYPKTCPTCGGEIEMVESVMESWAGSAATTFADVLREQGIPATAAEGGWGSLRGNWFVHVTAPVGARENLVSVLQELGGGPAKSGPGYWEVSFGGREKARIRWISGKRKWVVSFASGVAESVEPVITCTSMVPRIQRLLDAGARAAPRDEGTSHTFIVRYDEVARAFPGGLDRLTTFMEGPVGGLYYRVERPEDPVIVLELDDDLQRANLFATTDPTACLGLDPRVEFVDTAPVTESQMALRYLRGYLGDLYAEALTLRPDAVGVLKPLYTRAIRADERKVGRAAAAFLRAVAKHSPNADDGRFEIVDLLDQMGMPFYESVGRDASLWVALKRIRSHHPNLLGLYEIKRRHQLTNRTRGWAWIDAPYLLAVDNPWGPGDTLSAWMVYPESGTDYRDRPVKPGDTITGGFLFDDPGAVRSLVQRGVLKPVWQGRANYQESRRLDERGGPFGAVSSTPSWDHSATIPRATAEGERRASTSKSRKSGEGQTSPYGGFRIHVGGAKSRKPRKDIERALQNKRNARRGLAKRVKAAKDWHRSPEGERLHKALGRYNERPSGAGGQVRLKAHWEQRIADLLERWRPTQHLIEAAAQYAETIDDVLDVLLRKLLVIEALDILQDVEFDGESGSVYLFFDPSMDQDEIGEVVKVLQSEYKELGLIASPDRSLPEEQAPADWWVVFLPRTQMEGAQPMPDPAIYSNGEPPAPGAQMRQDIVVPAPMGSAEQVADEIDLDDLLKDFTGPAEAIHRLPANLQEKIARRMARQQAMYDPTPEEA